MPCVEHHSPLCREQYQHEGSPVQRALWSTRPMQYTVHYEVVWGGPGHAESSSGGDARARDGRLCPPALPIHCHTLISMIIMMLMPDEWCQILWWWPCKRGFLNERVTMLKRWNCFIILWCDKRLDLMWPPRFYHPGRGWCMWWAGTKRRREQIEGRIDRWNWGATPWVCLSLPPSSPILDSLKNRSLLRRGLWDFPIQMMIQLQQQQQPIWKAKRCLNEWGRA